jgi:hypothetical protein
MNRRTFVAGLGVAVGSLLSCVARAQRPIPVIGFLDPRSPHVLTDLLRAFRQGLRDTGYIEGENVAIDYRTG